MWQCYSTLFLLPPLPPQPPPPLALKKDLGEAYASTQRYIVTHELHMSSVIYIYWVTFRMRGPECLAGGFYRASVRFPFSANRTRLTLT